jgi:tetratricopeptide (TPR) repeat protein
MRSTAATVLSIVTILAIGCSSSNDSAPGTAAAPATSPVAASGKSGAPLFDNLGDYHHPITTRSKKAQRYFDQGLILAYAFNHPEAIRSFEEAARLDPRCAVAWWGVALNYGPNINKPMDKNDVPKAWAALQKARGLSNYASEKERALIEALSKRYAQNPPDDRAPLDLAYAGAMREVHRRFPDDLDVATLFAESLMDTMPWDYYTKEGQPKPATAEVLAALEGVLAKKADHAGACHYYIHAVEATEPQKAMAAADTLLNLVPGAGHLVHMPAHIYLRMGLYREASVSNELASRADEGYIAQCNAQGFYPATYYPHNVHFLWYTNSMEGRSRQAIDAAREITKHGGCMKLTEEDRMEPLLALVLVRFGKWDEVLAQPAPAKEKPFAVAMNHYARGLALAAKGKPDEAAREHAALRQIADSESAKALETIYLPGATLMRIGVHDLAGHLALKAGEQEKAVEELESAVKLEDGLPYMEPPFSYMPMRHGLGAAMLAAGKAAEAEKVYREDLRRNPGNGWSLLGLAQSLRAQGKEEMADEVTDRFNLAWLRADVKPASSRFQ